MRLLALATLTGVIAAQHEIGLSTYRSHELQDEQRPFAIRLRINEKYPGLVRLYEDPPIYQVDTFLTAAECDTLRAAGEPNLMPSGVMSGSGNEVMSGRTSSSAYLQKDDAAWLHERVAELTGKPIGHHEPAQITHYNEEGQKYDAHFDAFQAHTESGMQALGWGGQRVATVIVYLNDVPNGGTTSFPAAKISVKPKKGRAVIFFPTTLDGFTDLKAQHAADPSIDEKFITQVWIRQREIMDYRPWTFPGWDKLIPTETIGAAFNVPDEMMQQVMSAVAPQMVDRFVHMTGKTDGNADPMAMCGMQPQQGSSMASMGGMGMPQGINEHMRPSDETGTTARSRPRPASKKALKKKAKELAEEDTDDSAPVTHDSKAKAAKKAKKLKEKKKAGSKTKKSKKTAAKSKDSDSSASKTASKTKKAKAASKNAEETVPAKKAASKNAEEPVPAKKASKKAASKDAEEPVPAKKAASKNAEEPVPAKKASKKAASKDTEEPVPAKKASKKAKKSAGTDASEPKAAKKASKKSKKTSK